MAKSPTKASPNKSKISKDAKGAKDKETNETKDKKDSKDSKEAQKEGGKSSMKPVESKEPAAKEKEPAAKDKEPAAKDKEPAAKDKEPAAKDKEPAKKEAAKETGKEEKEPEKDKDKEPKDSQGTAVDKRLSITNAPALSADPEIGYFQPGGSVSDHMLANTGDKRLAVKIRCSNNALYRVTPVIMFIEPGQCQNITVTRLPGPNKVDKLIVQFVPCNDTEKDPKNCFPNKNTGEWIKITLKMTADKEKDNKYCSRECI